MDRLILLIVIHCSDSNVKSHDNIETIRKWHLARGFNDIGYHYFIDSEGGIFKGRDDWLMGAHAKGYNRNSIGICLSGKHNFTFFQAMSLNELLVKLKSKYPNANIVPHSELNNHKTCPNFEHNFTFGGLNGYTIEQKSEKRVRSIIKAATKDSGRLS